MTYANTAAVSNAPINTQDLECQHAITPQLNQQKNRGWNLKKGALALVCAATAGVTLRELAIQHFNSPLNGHASRTLTTEATNSTTANSTCPDGFYRFDKALTLKRAKIAAGIGIGLLPGLGIASTISLTQMSDMNYDSTAGSVLFFAAGSCAVGVVATIPMAAVGFHQAKSIEDGTCLKSSDFAGV